MEFDSESYEGRELLWDVLMFVKLSFVGFKRIFSSVVDNTKVTSGFTVFSPKQS